MPQSWDAVLSKVRKKQSRPGGMVSTIRSPQSMGGGAVYTGAGPDGIIQPNRPAMMDHATRPPTVLHEDEIVKTGPGGRVNVIPSRFTAPESNAEQMELSSVEKKLHLPGFKVGGGYGTIPEATINYGQSEIPQNMKASVLPAGSAPETAVSVPLPQGMSTTVLPGSSPQNAISVPLPTSMSDINPASRRYGYNPNIPDTSPAQINYGQSALPDNMSHIRPPEPEPPQPKMPILPSARESMYKSAEEEGLAGVRDVARGQSQVSQDIMDKSLNRFDATAASEQAATIQRLRSQGWSDNDIQAYMAQQQRGTDISRSDMVGDLTRSAQQRAEDAQLNLASIGREGYESEEAKNYNRQMDMVNTLIKTGGEANYAQAAEILSAQFPFVDIDFGNLVTGEKNQQFSTAMSQLSDIVASGINFNAIPADTRASIAKALGTTVNNVELMYDKLNRNTNPLLAEFDAIKELLGESWNSLAPNEQSDLYDAWTSAKLGELGMNIQRGPDGKITTLSFDVVGDVEVPPGTTPDGVFFDPKTNTVYQNSPEGPISIRGDSIQNLWGSTANQALALFPPESEDFKQLITRRADDVISTGNAQIIDTSTPGGRALYDALVNSPKAIQGVGGRSVSNEKSSQKNWQFSNLENIAKNDVVVLDGKVYYYETASENTVKRDTNQKTYYLIGADDGVRYEVSTKNPFAVAVSDRA